MTLRVVGQRLAAKFQEYGGCRHGEEIGIPLQSDPVLLDGQGDGRWGSRLVHQLGVLG